MTKTVSGDQNLLPIWHKVSKNEVMGYSPSLADRLARNTDTQPVELRQYLFDGLGISPTLSSDSLKATFHHRREVSCLNQIAGRGR